MMMKKARKMSYYPMNQNGLKTMDLIGDSEAGIEITIILMT